MQHTKVAIIGSGPAGYTAALYTGRANLSPVEFAGEKAGGQLINTTEIENFPGLAQGKFGAELMADMRAQATKFGADIKDQYVTAVDFSVRPFKLWTHFPAGMTGEDLEKATAEQMAEFVSQVKSTPHDIEAEAVILAVGATAKMLNVPGEAKFFGRGVSTCAVCDAAFYRNRTAIVVGGGDTAMEETLALTKFASHVTLLVRGDALRASKVMQDRVVNDPKVTVMYQTTIKEIRGEMAVKEVTLVNTATQAEQVMPIDGVFIAIGHTPMTRFLYDQVSLDSHGYILTRQSLGATGVEMARLALSEDGRVAYPTMTSVEGVFAAGDVVDTRYWQAVTAAAQGCMAAIDAERWLEKR